MVSKADTSAGCRAPLAWACTALPSGPPTQQYREFMKCNHAIKRAQSRGKIGEAASVEFFHLEHV